MKDFVDVFEVEVVTIMIITVCERLLLRCERLAGVMDQGSRVKRKDSREMVRGEQGTGRLAWQGAVGTPNRCWMMLDGTNSCDATVYVRFLVRGSIKSVVDRRLREREDIARRVSPL